MNEPDEAILRMRENIQEYYGENSGVILCSARVEKERVKAQGGLAQAFEKEKSWCIGDFYNAMEEKGIKREAITDVCVIPMWELMEKDAFAYYLPVELKASFCNGATL